MPRRSSPRYSPDAHRRSRYNNGYRDRKMNHRGRGEYREEKDEAVSDDDIRADSRSEYRRLKRIKMRERNVQCIWKNTPSPPPEENISDIDDLTNDEEVLEALKRQDAILDDRQIVEHEEHLTKREEVVDKALRSDDILQSLMQEELQLFCAWVEKYIEDKRKEEERRLLEEEESKFVGPVPIVSGLDRDADYGTHMRPGEATAMAAFVKQGERIPRRGEVGLDAEQIDRFEKVGYVMSGNRNAKMNAVRLRKENQVYSAEEKAALAMLNFEEKKKKEAQVIEDLKRLVEKTVDKA